MKTIMEKSKYLVVIAVIFSLAASAAAFVWGAAKTVSVVLHLVTTSGKDPEAAISLIELMDTFLIATALLLFSVGLYELFVEDVELPRWLVIRDLQDLKTKLGSVIVLVLSVTFLKHLVEWKDPPGTLFFGLAVALVSAALIAFGHYGKKD